jgi:arylsulfatase A-like enzyme
MRFAWLLLLWASTVTAGEIQRYHVVVITADAMRADMIGPNGSDVKTPALDALAAEGINFKRAYTNVTTTTPSHATLFSSLYPHDHKAYSNMAKISDAMVMLPEILKAKGWHTAGYVNMSWLNLEVSNIPQGITEFHSCKYTRKADRTNRWVLRFLDSRKDKPEPFFLWVHYIDTHTPYYAPGEYERMYYPKDKDPRAGKSGTLQEAWKFFPKHHRDNAAIKKWLGGITDADYVVGTVKGSVSWTDKHIGDLIARLKKNGQWERTLFVFTSDHGESLGEHNLWFIHGGLFEPTVRVPLIIKSPGGPAGKQSDEVVSLVDVMPTILARLGLPLSKQLRGKDMFKALEGKSLSGGVALLEHAGNYILGVVTPRYKYIYHRRTRKDIYPSYHFIRGKEELYDLENDPKEEKNLIKEKPELAKEMGLLLKKLRSGKKKFKSSKAKIDKETEEMLRSLGYTE